MGGPALVPDMMYRILDIFNPANARLLAAAAAGATHCVSPHAPCCLSTLAVMHPIATLYAVSSCILTQPFCSLLHILMHSFLHLFLQQLHAPFDCIWRTFTWRTRRRCSSSLTCSNQPALQVCTAHTKKSNDGGTCIHVLAFASAIRQHGRVIHVLFWIVQSSQSS